jgi:hypothetical protein
MIDFWANNEIDRILLENSLFLSLLITVLKRIVAAILLICLFLNFTGYNLIFYFRQKEVKAEMKEILHSSLVNKYADQLVFSLEDKTSIDGLEWKGSDEFSWKGEMYDLVESKTKNGKLVIRCINDKNETKLQKDYEKMQKDDFKGKSSRNTATEILKFVNSIYVCEIVNIPVLNIISKEKYFCTTGDNLRSFATDVLTPPPQLA